MNLQRFKDHGYSIILNRDGESAEFGFGYGDGTENNGCAPCLNYGLEKVLTQAETWETTLGRKYNVYLIKEDQAQLVTRASIEADNAAYDQIMATGFKVELAETYKWSHAKLRGLLVYKDGQRLRGMITIDANDVPNSLDRELARYTDPTGYQWIEKDGDKKIFRSEPWADLSYDEIGALRIEVLSTVF